MDFEKRDYYLKKVPLEARETVNALKNDNTWAIFNALNEEGIKTFTEIRTLFDANPKTINAELKRLVNFGLISKQLKGGKGSDFKKNILYCPTGKGLMFYNTLFEMIQPQQTINIVKKYAVKESNVEIKPKSLTSESTSLNLLYTTASCPAKIQNEA